MNPKNTDSKEPLEFYEHTTNIDPNFCDHRFHRLSVTRVMCKRCGFGFFDNPMSPFPVTEINNMLRREKKENDELKEAKKDDIENTE